MSLAQEARQVEAAARACPSSWRRGTIRGASAGPAASAPWPAPAGARPAGSAFHWSALAPALLYSASAVRLRLNGGRVGQPERGALLVALGLGQAERLRDQRDALAGRELAERPRPRRRPAPERFSPTCVGVSSPPYSQQLRAELVADLVAAGQQPAVARVGGAGIEREGGRVRPSARAWARRSPSATPSLHSCCPCSTTVPWRFSRSTAGSGETIERSALALNQSVGLKPIAAPLRTFTRPRSKIWSSRARPAQVGLAQRVDVLAGRHAVAVDQVEPVGEHGAQPLRHAGVEAEVERAALRCRSANPSSRSSPCPTAPSTKRRQGCAGCVARGGRLVGQRERVQVVGRRGRASVGRVAPASAAPSAKAQR